MSEGEGPRCAGSPENVVRAASPLCIVEGRREGGGEEQEVSLSTPLLPRIPPSLPPSLTIFFSLSALSLSSFFLSVSTDHTLTQACLHHSSLHINDYIENIEVSSMEL